MIFRLEYKNRNGLQARLDITTPGSSTVKEIEGTEHPFILSYKGDKSDKSSHFLTSSAEINIYETPEFNIDTLKTSSETQIKVDYYIDDNKYWEGFVIPDFFSREIGGAGVVSMSASDRLSTLKGVTLSDLPAMVQIRDLAVRCLAKTGLDLPLKTMADFRATDLGFNQYFRSEIISQRLYDSKGRSISCYDILKSILVASGSTLRQRGGEWHIINKLQHEAGVGRVYNTENTSVDYVESVHHFDEIVKGARRTIIPVAGSVGIYHEYGGGKLHPDNYDFSQGLTGWTPVGGFVAGIGSQSVNGYKIESGVYVPDYGEPGLNHLKNANPYQRNVNPIYLESAPISVPYSGSGAVNIEFDINGIGPMLTTQAVMRIAIVAQKGGELLTLHHGGAFNPMPSTNPPVFEKKFKKGFTSTDFTAGADTQSMRVSGTLESSELEGWELKIRIYGGGSSNTILINAASIHMKSSQETPRGAIYKRDQGSDFTKTHDIETSIFGDYLTTGKDGYFYDYPIDDTSSLRNPYSGISSLWTTPYFPTETDALPLLQHVVRQQARMFSVAHDLISGEIEIERFDPLSIFVDCNGNRYVIVSASFDFLRSNVKVELEEIAYANLTVRDFIYSYFGEGEEGIKSIGGISGGAGSGGTGGGLTPEQLEILSFWKKDPDRENTIFTEMNAYSKLELSAYGAGDGGGGGGGDGTVVSWGTELNGGVDLTVDGISKTLALHSALTDKQDKLIAGSGITIVGNTISSTGGGGGEFWKLDENGNLFTEYNAYSTKELSAYGIGSGGGSGGSDYERLDTWADYDSSKAGWVLSAFLGNDLNTRVTDLENGSALTVNTTGTGNAITSISKAGSVITANKDLAFLETSIFNTHNNDNVRHITGAERTKWNSVVTNFEGLEIGGRNLVPSFRSNQWTIGENATIINDYEISFTKATVITQIDIPAQGNKEYTISLFAGVRIYLYNLDENKGTINTIRTFFPSDTNIETQYVAYTFRSHSDAKYIRFRIHQYSQQLGVFPSVFRNIKLEKGTKATDWSPAPEDQVSDWLTTDVNSFSFIKNKPTSLAGYGITDAYTMTEVDSALVSKLDKSVFDDLFEKVEVSTGVFAIKAKYNFYGVGEVSAYGIGSGGGSGGGSYERLDAWADYDSTKSGWVLSALLGNELNTRVGNLESGSATTVNTTGTGNAITSILKAGTVITANKDLTFSLTGHTHTISDITNLQTTLNNKLETSIFNTHNNDNIRHITGAERTKWDGVVTDFAGLEIGGRNLLLDSRNPNPFFGNKTFYLSKTLIEGQDYTLSYTYEHVSGEVPDGMVIKKAGFSPAWGIFQYSGDKRYQLTFTADGDEIGFQIFTELTTAQSDLVEAVIKEIKLEKGNKATDWTPAPEDQVSDWLTTDVNSFAFLKNKPTLLSQFTDNIGIATHIANISNPHNVTKAQVGLGNVDNTSDLNKPISTATQTALNLKANLASPTFTGTVTAPTFIGALNGNATSATTLQTSRTIWGQSFNGEANVSGAMTGVTSLAMTGALSGATTIEASTSVTTPKVIFAAAGWSMEQVGSELQMKHNNVLKMRFTSTGSIVATEEITAFG